MRDPTRIDAILGKLKVVWEKSPDLRFLQLVHNLQHDHGLGSREQVTWRKKVSIGGEIVEKEFPGQVLYDGFNVEDEVLLTALEKEIKNHGR